MTTKPTVKAVLKWTALILSFLLVLILLATWLINREPIQGKIRRAVTAQAGNLVTFRHLDLALLPRPHLTLTRAAVSVPGSISAVAQTAVVYPEILPLFTGRMLIARVRLEDPDVVVKLSEEPGAESAEDGRAGFAETRAEFRASLAADDASWARGRGWALSTGLIALPYYRSTNPTLAGISRRTIEQVLADDGASG